MALVGAAAPVVAAAPDDLQGLPPRRPLVIAPMVEHVFLCDEAAGNPAVASMHEAMLWCLGHRRDAASRIARTLDELEPGGPRGQIRVGYLAPLPLLDLYRRRGKDWVIDDGKLDLYLNLIRRIDRPVVVYLAANHFVSLGPLPDALAADRRNLLQLADGQPPKAGYFGSPIHPWTLLDDADIPVNRYRFQALRHVVRRLLALPRPARERIVAITLAGELHHLYPDFENGAGAFAPASVTDYSPASLAAFRRWLAQTYGTIGELNRRMGTGYGAFADVPAPAKDLRTARGASLAEHYDGFAGGAVRVTGWLWDPGNRVRGVDLHVDGARHGPVERGLNRQDVYRALSEVTTPNVGFRYDLDYRGLPPGRHTLQLVAAADDGVQYELARTQVVVLGRDHTASGAASRLPRAFPALGGLRGVRFALDLPRDGQSLVHNPLAADWDRFRQEQVVRLMRRFHDVAKQAGWPEDKLYSHQILPGANPNWNANLFAADRSLDRDMPWRLGVNLYGGATDNAWVGAWLRARGRTDYGVPEFNPQQWKGATVHRDSLLAHYRQGASFVSPYMVSTVPDRFKPPGRTPVTAMEIRPDNPAEGSSRFYQAIRELARD